MRTQWRRCRASPDEITGERIIRILHVVPTYLPATRYGGPIHSVHGLCRTLAAQGHDVEVYTTNVDGSGYSDVPLGRRVPLNGVGVSYFATGTPRRLYRSPAMKRALKLNLGSFDLLHIHAMFLWPGLAASRCAWKLGVPYVVSPRGMLVPELIAGKSRLSKMAWIRLFDGRMIRRAAAIHVTSRQEKLELASIGLNVSRVIEVPNGIDPPDLIRQQPAEREDFVLYLGRLHPKKGLELLLQAMQRLPGTRLVVGGDGDTDYVARLRSLAGALELGDRVEFLGHLDDARKWYYYRRAAMFVLPSLSENFGNAVLEAMCAACPVIVSPGVGLADTVVNERCGLVVGRDPELLATALRELLLDPIRRAQYGQNGTRVAQERYRWSGVAAEMAAAYVALAGPGPLADKGSAQPV